MFERFMNRFYGDYRSSFDGTSILAGLCYCVGKSDDEEGFEWRSFTPEHWELVKNMSDEEIFSRFPAAACVY